jgi:uncharacterized membrane protein YjjP (DUF1212 family)
MAALEAGRTLMEAGAGATRVENVVEKVARSLGAERVDLRIGYASLAITVSISGSGITRMRRVGDVGVNQRLNQAVWDLARTMSGRHLTPEQTRGELACIATDIPRHGRWVTALAVGAACAAFGRLLGVDWLGIGPVFAAATIGQLSRSYLLAYRVNVFVCAVLVSTIAASITGIGAHVSGTATRGAAMVSSVLLLVPGVPSVNGQTDILSGRPTLGTARLATVLMTLIFITIGLWIGQVAVEALPSLWA